MGVVMEMLIIMRRMKNVNQHVSKKLLVRILYKEQTIKIWCFIIDQCTQPVEAGPCEGEFNRFYYDTITGQCRSFIYGGCKKNKNNFVTLKDCLKTCVEPRQKGRYR
jgi:hypothetical protein